jgi:hypothetical protein
MSLTTAEIAESCRKTGNSINATPSQPAAMAEEEENAANLVGESSSDVRPEEPVVILLPVKTEEPAESCNERADSPDEESTTSNEPPEEPIVILLPVKMEDLTESDSEEETSSCEPNESSAILRSLNVTDTAECRVKDEHIKNEMCEESMGSSALLDRLAML